MAAVQREKEGDLSHMKKKPYTNRKFENQWTTLVHSSLKLVRTPLNVLLRDQF